MEGGFGLREIVALVIGFLFIIRMIFKKTSIGTAMLVASIIMSCIAGLNILEIINTFLISVTEEATIRLLAVVCIICILSYLLQKYGILNKMADSFEELFNNNWFSLMLMPLLVGILSVPGGAIVSAPIVDSVGDKLGIGIVRKASINVVFRHIVFLIFPFSANVILVSQISGVNPYTIVKYNLFLGIVSIIVSYMIFIRSSVIVGEKKTVMPGKNIIERLGSVVLYTSPLWIGIAFNLVFRIPFSLALFSGVIIAYLLGGKHKDSFIKEIWRGINWRLLYTIIGIMCLQGFIRQMPAIAQTINTLLESGMDVRILIILSTAIIGLLMGNSNATNGMLLPLFLPHTDEVYSIAYITSLLYASSFMFYFISPMHMCQVFTAEYFGIEMRELYREYKLYWPILAVTILFIYVVAGQTMWQKFWH